MEPTWSCPRSCSPSARQLKRDARASPATFLRALQDRRWVVEAYRESHALRAAHLAPSDDVRWEAARDAVIASHVLEADVLLTANVGDFLELGLDAKQLRDPSRVL